MTAWRATSPAGPRFRSDPAASSIRAGVPEAHVILRCRDNGRFEFRLHLGVRHARFQPGEQHHDDERESTNERRINATCHAGYVWSFGSFASCENARVPFTTEVVTAGVALRWLWPKWERPLVSPRRGLPRVVVKPATVIDT